MQYLLSEKEYKKLKEDAKAKVNKTEDIIQKLCAQVAENKPIIFWGNIEPKIWGCCCHGTIDNSYGYCDECPVQNECPEPYKKWSK